MSDDKFTLSFNVKDWVEKGVNDGSIPINPEKIDVMAQYLMEEFTMEVLFRECDFNCNWFIQSSPDSYNLTE